MQPPKREAAAKLVLKIFNSAKRTLYLSWKIKEKQIVQTLIHHDEYKIIKSVKRLNIVTATGWTCFQYFTVIKSFSSTNSIFLLFEYFLNYFCKHIKEYIFYLLNAE